MTENNTKIPTWEQQLDEIENKMLEIGAQRDNALALLEHCQRELALALVKIEELEKRG